MAELRVESGEIVVAKTKAKLTNFTIQIVCSIIGPKYSGISGGHVFVIENKYGDKG